MLKQKYQFKNYNWVLIGAVLILSGMGVLFINSADSSYTSKQLVGLIFCTGVMLFLSVVNFNFVCGFNRVLYMINIVLLVLVKLVGVSVNGAQRWINLGFTRLQPSELTKIIMIIFVAVYIQEHEEDLMEWKVLLKLALLCALPLFLVVIEPNLSTTLDITFILLSVIFVGGFSMALIKKWLKIIIPVMIPLGFLFIWYIQTPNQILLHDYQVTRIMTFLEPSKYSSTSAYQQDNSVMAIGSGKLYGKGLNNNTIADVAVADTGFLGSRRGNRFCWKCYCYCIIGYNSDRMFKDGICGKEYERAAHCLGNGGAYRLSIIYKHWSGNGISSEYRIAVTIRKLWINITFKLYGRYRDCAKYRITKTLLGGEIYEYWINRT